MAVKGKAKGSAFERQFARTLTKWLTGQNKELSFWRSPGSGSCATINPGNKSLSGDIIALTPESAWVCDLINWELKNGYSNASFDAHLKQNKNEPLKKFWEQSCRDAKEFEKYPVVVFKKKGMPNIWCGISNTLFLKFKELNNVRHIKLNWGSADLEDIIFLNLDDFLNLITPEKLKYIMQ